MKSLFPIAPRYRLDDVSPWLEGIDPSRNYWIAVNGSPSHVVSIPGLQVSSFEDFKQIVRQWRSLHCGEQMEIERIVGSFTIHCISDNCFAIATEFHGAPVWHLFDRETLDSLLMTAHPDWICAPKDVELGRKMLMRSWQQAALA
ncbi:hypothetical protein [Phormidium sp. CCY1219]|jgi:hypothetical protein|uniref:hypothetical protein n=1 Tax=Phormidium sp. CCY1219 TaxID=2886104 RepID=UPI002D1F63C4|nr:hypothetical protein [Phormidium sp. CCY1219]MEB3827237.1 hypothetical protein [Phormidium sp. CCY1219]